MNAIFHDLRFSLRLIRRNPVTSAVIVGTLALGIVANVAMFAGFDAWVLRDLDFPEPDQLAALHESQPKLDRFRRAVSAPNLRDWRERQRSFEQIGALRRTVFNFNDEQDPARISGAFVTAELFPLLGVQPVRGRNFLDEEDDPGSAGDRVLISDLFWRNHLHSDPEILGKSIRIDGRLREVVGVMEPEFRFPEWADLWLPLILDPAVEDRSARTLSVVARLRDGVSLEQADAEMKAIGRQLERLYPEANRDWSVEVIELHDTFVPPVIEVALAAALAAAFCVLIVVCANIASLLLAQATARRRETAVRAALGAGRGRLVRQWLTECTVLALIAGAIGAALGDWAIGWMKSWAPVQPPYLFEYGFDARAMAYTLAVSLFAGLACGLAAVVRNSGMDVYQSLKLGAGGESASGGLLRSSLVVGEFGLAMALLVGALLMALSFLNQQSIDPGFRVSEMATLNLSMSGKEFERSDVRLAQLKRVLTGLDSLPEVTSSAAVSRLPVSNGYDISAIDPEGRAVAPEDLERATIHGVSSDYLETLELPLKGGRLFTEQECLDGADVAVISDALGRRLWAGVDPVGRRFQLVSLGERPVTVVGVVGSVHTGHRMVSSGSLPEDAQIYLPMASWEWNSVHLVLRSAAPLAALTPRVQEVLRATAPGLPISEIITMEAAIDRVQWVLRMFSRTFVLYAAIALGIAVLGVYGVTADSVGRRLREMAIRRALGATRRDLLRLIGKQGLVLASLGTILGSVLALPATQFGASMLYGVSPWNPIVFAAVGLLLIASGTLASLLPARRLLKTDLTTTLRAD